MNKFLLPFSIFTILLLMNCNLIDLRNPDSSILEITPVPTPTPTPFYFLDFNDLTTDSDLSGQGWTLYETANCWSRVKEFPSVGNKSLQIYDNDGSTSASLEYNFPVQTDHMIFEWKWLADHESDWGRIALADLSPHEHHDTNVGIYIILGNIGGDNYSMLYRSSSGTDIKFYTYAVNTWYLMKLDINITAQTYTIYVDGNATTAVNVPFRYTDEGANSSLSWLFLQCSMKTSTGVSCYYDDITLVP